MKISKLLTIALSTAALLAASVSNGDQKYISEEVAAELKHCPEVHSGWFKKSDSAPVKMSEFKLTVTKEKIIFVAENEEFIIDGKVHYQDIESSPVNYAASCKNGKISISIYDGKSSSSLQSYTFRGNQITKSSQSKTDRKPSSVTFEL